MKHKVIAALVLLVCLGLCACAAQPAPSEPTQAPTEKPTAAPILQSWPEELSSLPAFTEYETFEYAGQTAAGWEISLLCSLEQLENWRNEANEHTQIHGEFSVFHNGEYVVQLDQSYAQGEQEDLRRVKLYLTRVKEQVWPEELADFPAYEGQGAVTAPFSVDTQYIENWTILEATLYGESRETFDAYLQSLLQAGFEERETEDGISYLRLRGGEADQLAYEFSAEATVTVTWAICPAADLAEE